MSFFRNREVKKFTIFLAFIFIVSTISGFFINFFTGLLIISLCVVLYISFYLFTRNRYKNIASLSEQMDIVLHGNESFSIEAYHEGELSILQSEINKMTVRLKEQSGLLKKEKIYLSDSIADIAHQLKTPLTSINMITAFLKDPKITPDKHIELIRELDRLLSRIDWLISTLLKISKIDAGTAVFQKEQVSVKELIKKAAEPLAILLDIRNIKIETANDPNVYFLGDLNWSAEAVGNIIKNCMESMGSDGTITILYNNNGIFTEINIKDNGSGISKEDMPHIFDRFYRGKSNKNGNFGIGLALSRMIFSMQNGTIKASNNPTGGACFTIKLYHFF